jgi:DNA modification methylase
MISQFYTWENEKIGLYNTNWFKLKTNRIYSEIEIDKKTLTSSFEKTNLYRFFEKISEFKNEEKKVIKLTKEIELFNSDSSLEINKLKLDQIGCAITSPPYYNAREYSQWGNILFYLIDMQINAQSIFNKIDNNGAYLYNIGDINGNDNLYVDSNMSNRRLPLGAYTYLIFSIIGWNVNGNIIWDKGQVQSKRNSTINLFAGYIRPINSYEHIMIFQKTPTSKNLSYIKQLSPVIKINSKGVNTYKHTAPYPIQIVDTVESFLIPGKYLLDPFLGSGTTLIWCKNKKIKGVGFELNKTYYELAVSRIFNTDVYSNIGLFD